MKELGGWVLGLIAAIAVILVISFVGLKWNRFAQPYAEETRRQTYEHSASREQGVENQISAYCLNMRTAKDTNDKKAFANFVTTQAAQFSGNLSPDAQQCVNEAKGVLSPVAP